MGSLSTCTNEVVAHKNLGLSMGGNFCLFFCKLNILISLHSHSICFVTCTGNFTLDNKKKTNQNLCKVGAS